MLSVCCNITIGYKILEGEIFANFYCLTLTAEKAKEIAETIVELAIE